MRAACMPHGTNNSYPHSISGETTNQVSNIGQHIVGR